MIKIAVPNKGSLSDAAQSILKEAGYKTRGYSKALAVADTEHDIEFFFLRPKDIAIYVANGQLDLGITGRDLAADSRAAVDEVSLESALRRLIRTWCAITWRSAVSTRKLSAWMVR